MMKKNYLLMLFFTTLLSCDEGNSNQCKYIEGLQLYMQKIHKEDLTEINGDKIFYFLHLRSCEPCVDKNLSMLAEVSKHPNLKICLVGKIAVAQFEEKAKLVMEKHLPYLDIDSEIYSFETGFSKPLLVHIKDGRCVTRIQVSDSEVDNAKKYISGVINP